MRFIPVRVSALFASRSIFHGDFLHIRGASVRLSSTRPLYLVTEHRARLFERYTTALGVPGISDPNIEYDVNFSATKISRRRESPGCERRKMLASVNSGLPHMTRRLNGKCLLFVQLERFVTCVEILPDDYIRFRSPRNLV